MFRKLRFPLKSQMKIGKIALEMSMEFFIVGMDFGCYMHLTILKGIK